MNVPRLQTSLLHNSLVYVPAYLSASGAVSAMTCLKLAIRHDHDEHSLVALLII